MQSRRRNVSRLPFQSALSSFLFHALSQTSTKRILRIVDMGKSCTEAGMAPCFIADGGDDGGDVSGDDNSNDSGEF